MTLVEGSVLSAADLMRCKAERAAAIVVMGDRCVLGGREGKRNGARGGAGWKEGTEGTGLKGLGTHTVAEKDPHINASRLIHSPFTRIDAGSRTTPLPRTWTCCSACGPSRATPSACRSPCRYGGGTAFGV